MSVLILGIGAVVVVIGILNAQRGRKVITQGALVPGQFAGAAVEAVANGLDHWLMMFSPSDPFSIRDLLVGGVLILGRTSSGKTSSSGRVLGESIVAYPKSAMVIVAAKPEDLSMWREIFRKQRRENDLIEVSPTSGRRCNFLDYEMQHDGEPRNLTQFIMTVSESLGRGGNKEGKDPFWKPQKERLIYNAIVVLKLAKSKITAPDLQKFIITAALKADQLTDPSWQKSFHNECLAEAYAKSKSPVEAHDCQLAMDYWCGEYPNMAEKTRTSILADVMATLHVFNTGIVRELVSGDTNVSPDDLKNGKSIIINLPPSEYGEAGLFVGAGWKYLVQRMVLRIHAKEDDPIIGIWADEAHQAINSFDHSFTAQSRSRKGFMVFLSQSLASFYANVPGKSGEHEVNALLANFGTKIIHPLACNNTATWAQESVGKSLQTFGGGSMQRGESLYDECMGNGNRFTPSWNAHFEHILQANEFFQGRTGGPENGYTCDAIVIKSGERFSNGQYWLRTSFPQQR